MDGKKKKTINVKEIVYFYPNITKDSGQRGNITCESKLLENSAIIQSTSKSVAVTKITFNDMSANMSSEKAEIGTKRRHSVDESNRYTQQFLSYLSSREQTMKKSPYLLKDVQPPGVEIIFHPEGKQNLGRNEVSFNSTKKTQDMHNVLLNNTNPSASSTVDNLQSSSVSENSGEIVEFLPLNAKEKTECNASKFIIKVDDKQNLVTNEVSFNPSNKNQDMHNNVLFNSTKPSAPSSGDNLQSSSIYVNSGHITEHLPLNAKEKTECNTSKVIFKVGDKPYLVRNEVSFNPANTAQDMHKVLLNIAKQPATSSVNDAHPSSVYENSADITENIPKARTDPDSFQEKNYVLTDSRKAVTHMSTNSTENFVNTTGYHLNNDVQSSDNLNISKTLYEDNNLFNLTPNKSLTNQDGKKNMSILDIDYVENDVDVYFQKLAEYVSSTYPLERQINIQRKICDLVAAVEMNVNGKKN